MKKFSLITAFTKNGRGIGFKNQLPWQNPKYNLPRGIPEDFKYFQDVTTATTATTALTTPERKNSVIMGRRTFESMNCKPLKDRINFVLTSQQNYNKNGNIIVCSSLNHAINHPVYQGCDQAFIIGGSSLYKEAMDHELCDRIYTTEVDSVFEYDTVFPEIKDNFALEEEKHLLSKTGIHLGFKTYRNMYDIQSDENQYLQLVKDIMENGEAKEGRNGQVLSMFGPQHVFDLQKGFPLLTTKRMFFSGIIKELLFFLRGETDSKILEKDGVKIWNGNTTREFLDDR
jgi:dihydrofolate reductase